MDMDLENEVDCKECMKHAPYHWCCKLVCGEKEFCRNCNSESMRVTNHCPYRELVESKAIIVDKIF